MGAVAFRVLDAIGHHRVRLQTRRATPAGSHWAAVVSPPGPAQMTDDRDDGGPMTEPMSVAHRIDGTFTQADIDQTRNLNSLIAAYTATMPSFSTTEGLAELRTRPSELQGPPVRGVITREVPGPDGPIAIRQIEPPNQPRAVHLDLHGGGWCIGEATANDSRNEQLSHEIDVVVVSADYRLAPEHPFPAAPDDAEAVASWLLDESRALWGTERLTIGGGSAGAHLSALTLVRLRDLHGTEATDRFAAAVLDAGAFDLSLTPSARASDEALVIPRDVLDACIRYFVPGREPESLRDPALSPLFADLSGLPPALFLVGELDPLLDDSLFMAARWQAAGNRAELGVYPESVHGFTAFPTVLAAHARARAIAFLDDALGNQQGW